MGNGNITIADALEILKYIAGIDSLITPGNEAWEAALITGEATPTIHDALEILKYIAGIPGKLDVRRQ
jgi:hypothetical protein